MVPAFSGFFREGVIALPGPTAVPSDGLMEPCRLVHPGRVRGLVFDGGGTEEVTGHDPRPA